MKKPIHEFIFRPMMGKWMDAGTQKVLADVLTEYGLVIDDNTEFARIKDYANGVYFIYRASAGKVTLTIDSLD